METKGIIISQKEYERITELEKNFNDRVKENKEAFKKGLEDAIKGNLVKVLWTNDQLFASIAGCDLSEEGIDKFIRREAADEIDATSRTSSYNRNKVLKGNSTQKKTEIVEDHKEKYTKSFVHYKRIIRKQKREICNLRWSFGMMFVAWILLLIFLIIK